MIVLKAGGARTVVEIEEATQILNRFSSELEQHGDCHTLNLSCRAWRVDSLKILEPVLLQVVATVRNLKIDDIIASLPTAEGLASLEFIANLFSAAPALKCVNLSDNAVGTRGITCLRLLLTNSSITSISLENCGLAEADGASLRNLWTDSCNNRQLQELTLSRNQMGAIGAAYIGELLGHASVSGLQSLSYAGSRPLPAGTAELCRGLAKLSKNCGASGTRLHTLDLNDCCLGGSVENNDPVVDLCSVLRNSPRLHKLNLRDGELNVSGLKMILDALRTSGAALAVLDLGAIGDLGADGGRLVRDFFLSNGPTSAVLQELYFDTNELGDDGIVEVVTGIAGACRSLRVLDISQNELVDVASLLRYNHVPTLQKLKLEDNPDMKSGAALRELLGMYEEVTVDEELEEDGDNDFIDGDDEDALADDLDDSVNVLADTLEASHL